VDSRSISLLGVVCRIYLNDTRVNSKTDLFTVNYLRIHSYTDIDSDHNPNPDPDADTYPTHAHAGSHNRATILDQFLHEDSESPVFI
jgi:hypothetical protein